MDSFLRLYKIYYSTSRWQIAVRIYTETKHTYKIILWLTKLLFIALAITGLLIPHWHPFFWAMIIVSGVWMWAFSKARAVVFAEEYRLYPERIKYYGKDFQYIRYLTFRKKLGKEMFAGNLEDAIKFLNGQIETDSHSSVASHPLISFSLAAILAVIGGAAGQWKAEYIVTVILVLVMILYFSYVVIGITRTPQSDLKEFKRFLLWVNDEKLVSLANSGKHWQEQHSPQSEEGRAYSVSREESPCA